MKVEAQSLASVTEIASNPPAQWHSGLPSSALTLYIVRVPGTRDVFLSPLKPGDRVVHAHDVQSSLYYLHADALDDELEPKQASLKFGSETRRIARKDVAVSSDRRPLPTPPASPDLADEYPWSPKSLPSLPEVPQRKPVMPARKPLQARSNCSDETNNSAADSSVNGAAMQTMTLIRRDPATGDQWNIGRISDPPVEEVSSTTSSTSNNVIGRVKNAGAPLHVNISNVGYRKFIDPGKISDYGPESSSETFCRRLWMEASRHANHTYASRRPSSIASLGALSPSKLKPASHQSQPEPPRGFDRSKGYAFYDPWENRCEFGTTTTGRALKCRRLYQQRTQESEAAFDDISELRFNLPTYHQRSRSDRAQDDLARGPKRRSIFSHPSLPPDASSVGHTHARHNSDDESIDYSLGRERAGGGFAGREPKLGKLIIYPHGLQMIDLVVAANLALWWRAYERCSGQ